MNPKSNRPLILSTARLVASALSRHCSERGPDTCRQPHGKCAPERIVPIVTLSGEAQAQLRARHTCIPPSIIPPPCIMDVKIDAVHFFASATARFWTGIRQHVRRRHAWYGAPPYDGFDSGQRYRIDLAQGQWGDRRLCFECPIPDGSATLRHRASQRS